MSAYWIAHVTVTDPEAYKGYQERAAAVFAKFGAVFLARGGEAEVPEGPALQRHVIIRFPTLADARACYNSPDYQQARRFREHAATAHVTLVDGV
jgi:uncharacterized protein (DUF1330 family)